MSGWKVRCFFRTSHILDLQGDEKTLELGDCKAVLKAENGISLDKSNDFFIEVADIGSQEEAEAVGDRINDALLLSAASLHWGVYPKGDRKEDYIKIINPNAVPMPTVAMTGTSSAPAATFLDAFSHNFKISAPFPIDFKTAMELYCESHMEKSQMAKLILVMSCIEELTKFKVNTDRPAEEVNLFKIAIKAIKEAASPEDTGEKKIFEEAKKKVNEGLGSLKKHKAKKRCGVELVSKYLPDEVKRFAELYDFRGKVAHPHEDRKKVAEYADAAVDLTRRLLEKCLQEEQAKA